MAGDNRFHCGTQHTLRWFVARHVNGVRSVSKQPNLLPKRMIAVMTTTETMNLKVQLRGMKNCGGLDLLIEENLHALRLLIPISSAQVVLEHQHAVTPAFRACAHLAVAGPDIHAAAQDHTLLAAWHKLPRNLTKQCQRRMTHQQLRHKGRGQCRSLASQWNRGA